MTEHDEAGERTRTVEPQNEKRFWLTLLFVASIALILRVGLAFYVQGGQEGADSLRFGDSDGYLHLAADLAEGRPYQYGWEYASVFRTPGYPMMLAPLVVLTDNDYPVIQARLLSALLGSISVVLIGVFGRRLVDSRVGLVSAVLTAIYPGALYTSVLVLAEAPFSVFMVVSLIFLWGFVRNASKCSWLDAVGFGLISALGTLVRPSWLLFVPFAIAIVLVCHRNKASVQFAIVSSLALLIGLAPWMIRNQLVVGRFVPTTLQTGSSLYDGLHQDADGASDMSFTYQERMNYLAKMREQIEPAPALPFPDKPRLTKHGDPTDEYWELLELEIAQIESVKPEWQFETGFDDYLRSLAIQWALDHPAEVGRIAIIKLGRMWNPFPNSQQMGGRASQLVLAVGVVGIVLLGLTGLVLNYRSVSTWLICLSPAVYFTMLHVIFVSSIRYREPAMLTLAILAAMGIVGLWDVYHARKRA